MSWAGVQAEGVRRVPVQDDLGAGDQPGVALDVLHVDLELGADRAVDDVLRGDADEAGVGDPAGDPVAAGGYRRPRRRRASREIFSGRTPTSTLPPVVAGAQQRAGGQHAACRRPP